MLPMMVGYDKGLVTKLLHANYWWFSALIETILLLVGVWYIFSSQPTPLILWDCLALTVVFITFTAAWTGMKVLRFSSKPLKSMFRWSRVSAIGASIVGITAAIDAVISTDKNNGDVVHSLIAAGGVMLSWALLHIGFVQIYQVVDLQSHAFSFPGKEYNQETWLNYLYLSFTIGVSFSTSDVIVVNHKGRRVMLLHSILSFFYNAIVVAMALQVIREPAR